MFKRLLFLIFVIIFSAHSAFSGEKVNNEKNVTMLAPPPPIELMYFYGEYLENHVLLSWATASEINNKGFYIERREQNDEIEWGEIGFVEGVGTTHNESSYTFSDSELEYGKIYLYRLKQEDWDGCVEFCPQTAVAIYSNGIEEKNYTSNFLVLNNAYPNPASDYVKIDFEINIPSNVKIEVLDMQGNIINNLANELMEAGEKSLPWNMNYSDGTPVPAGTYIIRLITGDYVRMMKVIKE